MSEEFLYLFTSNEVIESNKDNIKGTIFATEGWRAWSVRPMYDKDYNVLNTDVTPVEIPAWDVADDS